MKRLLFVLVALGAVIVWFWHSHRALVYPPGVLVSADPQQILFPQERSFAFGKFELTPLASFSAEVRVLHRKIYRYDRQAALAPVDLAVGWGPMSDQAVLDRISVSQSMRFFWYEYQRPPPIAPEEIVSHATNIHIIPAESTLLDRAKNLPAGALVRLRGKLVEATGPHLSRWRSSLSRTDSGNGACELLYLEALEEITAITAQQKTAQLSATAASSAQAAYSSAGAGEGRSKRAQ